MKLTSSVALLAAAGAQAHCKPSLRLYLSHP
jgi:hypothetical protein